MIEIRIETAAIDRLEKLPERLDWHVERQLGRFAQESARELKADAPKAESTLTNSILAEKTGPLEYTVGPHVRHAVFVHEGREPGGRMPPVQAIEDWLKVKGIQPMDPTMSERDLAFVVGRSIQATGIPANPFIRRLAESTAWLDRGRKLVNKGVRDAVAEARG